MPNGPLDVALGAPNAAAYTDNGDRTVTDNVTGLMWQQVVPSLAYSWANAVAYCPSLTLAGHSDWRLPSEIDLVSIVDFGTLNGTIDRTYFPTPGSGFWSPYWSSSPVAGSATEAWCVDFGNGYPFRDVVLSLHDVRCVR